MADPFRFPGGTGARGGPDQGTRGGRPRWGLVVVIVIAIVLLGLLVFLHLSGAIGPGIHEAVV